MTFVLCSFKVSTHSCIGGISHCWYSPTEKKSTCDRSMTAVEGVPSDLPYHATATSRKVVTSLWKWGLAPSC